MRAEGYISLFFIVLIIVGYMALSLLYVSKLSYIPAIVFYLIFISVVILMFNYYFNYLPKRRKYGRRRKKSKQHRLQYLIDFKNITKTWGFILLISFISSIAFYAVYQESKTPSPIVTTPSVKDKSKTSTNISSLNELIKLPFLMT